MIKKVMAYVALLGLVWATTQACSSDSGEADTAAGGDSDGSGGDGSGGDGSGGDGSGGGDGAAADAAASCADLPWEQGPTSLLVDAILLPSAQAATIRRCPVGGSSDVVEWTWSSASGEYTLLVVGNSLSPFDPPVLTSTSLEVMPATTAGLDTARFPFLACENFVAQVPNAWSFHVDDFGDALSVRLDDHRAMLAYPMPSAADLEAFATSAKCGTTLDLPPPEVSCEETGIVACQQFFSGALGADALRCFDDAGAAIALFSAVHAAASCAAATLDAWVDAYAEPCVWTEKASSFKPGPIVEALDLAAVPDDICFNIDRTIAKFQSPAATYTYTTTTVSGGGNLRGTRWTLAIAPPDDALLAVAKHPYLACSAFSASANCKWNITISESDGARTMEMDDIHPPCAATDWDAAFEQLDADFTECNGTYEY